MEFKVIKTSLNKNPFIGIYLKTNDAYTLAPKRLPEKLAHAASEALGTQLIELFVNQSPLIGLLTCLNQNGAILAQQSTGEEKKILKNLGLNVYVLKTPHAPGNVLLANNKAVLASPLLPKHELKHVSDCLGVESFQQAIMGINTVGATSVVTDNGVLAYNESSEAELKYLKKIFGVANAEVSSSNLGMPFNAYGIVANTKGALIGEITTGFETQKIYSALSK